MKIVLYRSCFFSPVRSQRGMSMIELLVTMSILAVMIAVAVPKFNSSMLNLPVAEQTLIADIRMARAHATSRGVHYQISLTSSSYSVQRLQDSDGDGVWNADSGFPAQTVDFPSDLSLSFEDGSSAVFEFTTRGLLVDQEDGSPAAIVTVYLHDSQDESATKTVQIWPSGQVEEV
jgi:prepilin-type N-terminal cleavage/methylation domain-containing protein